MHFVKNALYLHKTLFAMLITNDPDKEKDIIRLRFRLFTRFSLLCISLWLIAVALLAIIP